MTDDLAAASFSLTSERSASIDERLDARDESAPLRTRYRAKVDRVSPLARRDTFESEEACFLGISLENSNFTRAKLTGLVEWVSRRFRKCVVLVGDSIHRITLQSTRGLEPELALSTALDLGRAFVDGERTVFDGFPGTEFRFVTCNEIQAAENYSRVYDRLSQLFQSDASFRASVESFGRSYHGKHSTAVSAEELERRVAQSSQYFLEEFAVFACLYQRGLRVMVYPGSFSTLAEIAGGQHPGAPEELKQLTVVSLCLRGTR